MTRGLRPLPLLNFQKQKGLEKLPAPHPSFFLEKGREARGNKELTERRSFVILVTSREIAGGARGIEDARKF